MSGSSNEKALVCRLGGSGKDGDRGGSSGREGHGSVNFVEEAARGDYAGALLW